MLNYIIYWKQILVVTALVLFGGFSVYSKVKSIGYNEASEKYELLISQQKQLIDTKILNVERMSIQLSESSKVNSEVLTKDVKNIISQLKGKTLTVIKDGECLPSADFSSSFATINQRTNESIQK